jgi:heme/copper-type cytochrome/quinol oxidase subunit 1
VGLGFLSMFVVGGVSGLSLGNSELATAVHDTYFVVGHFHYVLSLGAVFGVLVGVLVVLFLLIGGTPTGVVALIIGTNIVF